MSALLQLALDRISLGPVHALLVDLRCHFNDIFDAHAALRKVDDKVSAAIRHGEETKTLQLESRFFGKGAL